MTSTADIAKIDWRGSASATKNFNIAIYPSIAGGSQPLVPTPDTNGNTALAAYNVAGLAGASVGTFNGIAMYDYHFDLPTTFQAQANTKYWLRILGDDGS
ncbi:hypothetical protein [Armatimonas rosea]|uniref:Uncharacterized protein n=1 Tax=Armatimonas rosea TaxID=685828 RepID=A0A7W9SXB2_ARMRO|nr:hypothetical protein [Armatimonas rosea]MBB6054085.1 hypothetical protein [Armatimonas rosea]